MQDERIPDQGFMLGEAQRLVLCVLLTSAGSGLCSMDELALAVGDPDAAQLAVAGLHATGLVHRLGEFVLATRPAVCFHELDVLVERRLAREQNPSENSWPRHGSQSCRGLHGKKASSSHAGSG